MTSDSESESDDEEYNQGPDIFEAAADEEIKEDHWCARFSFSFFSCCQMQKSNSIFSSLILKFSSPLSLSLLLFHRAGSITCAKI